MICGYCKNLVKVDYDMNDYLPESSPSTVALDYKEKLETYYKDGYALFLVTIEEEKRSEVVPEIYTLIGEDNAMTGSAVSTALATTSTVSGIQKISVIAVLFLLVILTLTTISWVEPLVVLLGLGVALSTSSILSSGLTTVIGFLALVMMRFGIGPDLGLLLLWFFPYFWK